MWNYVTAHIRRPNIAVLVLEFLLAVQLCYCLHLAWEHGAWAEELKGYVLGLITAAVACLIGVFFEAPPTHDNNKHPNKRDF